MLLTRGDILEFRKGKNSFIMRRERCSASAAGGLGDSLTEEACCVPNLGL